MKIRTDFVTNSSSSSFTTLVVTSKGEHKVTLYDDEGILYNLDIEQDRSGKLHGYGEDCSAEISSVADLAKFLRAVRCGISGEWFEEDEMENDDEDESGVAFQELVSLIPTLQDVKDVSFQCYETLWGESLEGYDYFLQQDFGSAFKQDCQKPLSDDLIEKWVSMLDEFLLNHDYRLEMGSTEELVKKAFASKELHDMAPDSISSVTENTIDFSKFRL